MTCAVLLSYTVSDYNRSDINLIKFTFALMLLFIVYLFTFTSRFDIISDNCENLRHGDKQSDKILQFFQELSRTCDKDLTQLRLNYISYKYHQPEQPIKLVALMH